MKRVETSIVCAAGSVLSFVVVCVETSKGRSANDFVANGALLLCLGLLMGAAVLGPKKWLLLLVAYGLVLAIVLLGSLRFGM